MWVLYHFCLSQLRRHYLVMNNEKIMPIRNCLCKWKLRQDSLRREKTFSQLEKWHHANSSECRWVGGWKCENDCCYYRNQNNTLVVLCTVLEKELVTEYVVCKITSLKKRNFKMVAQINLVDDPGIESWIQYMKYGILSQTLPRYLNNSNIKNSKGIIVYCQIKNRQ